MHLLRFTPLLFAVALTSCAEPQGFWTDTPKGEHEIHSVPPPPVAKKPGPVGLNVTFLRGYVRTPFTHPPRLVDVRGLRPGTLVVCPFTQKLFNLPLDFVDAPYHTRVPAGPVYHVRREASRTPPPASAVPALTAVAAPVFRDYTVPYAAPVPGRPGFVYSPYASHHQMVDVTGLAPGMEVKCPYTGKLFLVPVGK
ncbi:MAG: hypothetical protein JWR15_2176 [Prosthecobacter sp.]|nr:hypothetical protein [Prosthecobacter sp.]